MPAGLRLATRVPHELLRQVGASPATAGLTYLRLGQTPLPLLHHLTPLSCLQRLHMHVASAILTPLSHLTALTYLHLHGAFEDLAQGVAPLRLLRKLCLSRVRRVRNEDLHAIGRLTALTALELPAARTVAMPTDISPLSSLRVRASPAARTAVV